MELLTSEFYTIPHLKTSLHGSHYGSIKSSILQLLIKQEQSFMSPDGFCVLWSDNEIYKEAFQNREHPIQIDSGAVVWALLQDSEVQAIHNSNEFVGRHIDIGFSQKNQT